MIESSIPALLRERASLQPHDTAFTYVDFDVDPAGVPDSLTWSELHRRVVNLADDLREIAAHGDRALILAPQGMDYVVGYLGALEANLIAVPLAAPMHPSGDERIRAVLDDATPTVILTTSALVNDVARSVADHPARPAIVETDRLDLIARRRLQRRREDRPDVAYLQYTSGSTRTPAGVMVSHRNLAANFEQMTANFFADHGRVAPPGTTVVSWLPFYHDMGLLLGICTPILGGWKTVFTSPVAFLTKPARWMQLLASHEWGLTAAPNFAFDLTAARTSDADMAGRDLGNVLAIMSGAERVQPATVERFAKRFAPYNLPDTVIRPSYGLAEATLYVATRLPGAAPTVVAFDSEKLSHGVAERSTAGTPLVSYGPPTSPDVRIVDPESRREVAAGTIGEIWARGDNICLGYWNKPDESAHTFGGVLDDETGQTWLRTGDLGFLSDGELFIVGRLKDLLIVRGRNHYPDDIEATVSAISGGRSAAIAVDQDGTEQLVVVAEAKTDRDIVSDVTAAVANAHGLTVTDLVLVQRGSLPITTSGKIRRQMCVEQYLSASLARLDA
ncbi:AMP-binding protein [Mycobacterium sp. 236(2023)]|uniref:AMP-binding protein n=1 Tax=Mycobacterium sp. 236(2023) TaxID=3038163 RepID=UPI00241518AF|nr:AMP-binding protein [Mycobacterium sp. 236(2023)]MDG4668902.1 AMP-binding protein [Mycobacterium sp. 236(2023)]